MKSRSRAELALAGVTVIWGSTFVLVKSALADISTFLFLALRFTVAALVFELVTGSPYAEFPYEARAALRAVVGAQPRTFGECGVEPWPAAA